MGFSPFKESMNHLQCLMEFENISSAARHLGLTQPQMTKSLQSLERELGFRLFERTNRGLRSTNRGKEFFQKVNDLKRGWVSTSGGGQDLTGVFRISAHPILAFDFVPTLIEIVAAKFPLLTVQYKDRNSKEISDLVSTGAIELGIAANPVSRSGLVSKEIARQNVGIWTAGIVNSTLVVNPHIVQYSRYLKKIKFQNVIEIENYEVAAAVAMRLGCHCLLPEPIARKYSLKLKTHLDDVSIHLIYSEVNRNHPVISSCQFYAALKEVAL